VQGERQGISSIRGWLWSFSQQRNHGDSTPQTCLGSNANANPNPRELRNNPFHGYCPKPSDHPQKFDLFAVLVAWGTVRDYETDERPQTPKITAVCRAV